MLFDSGIERVNNQKLNSVNNLIFEIKGMLFSYWLVLFTTSCFANLLGLNISAGLNSVITIYILVPFLLIPQILFSGVLVKYDKLHKSLTNYEYVPVIGDMMASRWAYEALAVEQFKNNRFQKVFFGIEQEISSADYLQAYLIPKLEIKLNELQQRFIAGADPEKTHAGLQVLSNQLSELGKLVPEIPAYKPVGADLSPLNDSTVVSIQTYLKRISDLSRSRVGKGQKEKNEINKALIAQLGGLQAYTTFRNKYDNKSLSELVLDRYAHDKVVEKDGRMIRKHQPAYMKPTSRFGRAQLYAPNKQLGNFEIDTLWYNVIAIWLYTLALYLTLYHDLLRKVVTFSETRRLTRKQTT